MSREEPVERVELSLRTKETVASILVSLTRPIDPLPDWFRNPKVFMAALVPNIV